MRLSTTGRDGRWPHADAVESFLRHRRREIPTVRDVAFHEAGHVVVAHSVGHQPGFATARPSELGRGHHRVDKQRTPLCSLQGRIRTAFGGRAADERRERFGIIHLDSPSDETAALGHAAMLAGNADVATARELRAALEDARRIVGQRWADVERVAAALEADDLRTTELESLLGQPPVSPWPCDHEWGTFEFEVSPEAYDAGVRAMLDSLPYAVALTRAHGGSLVLAWRDIASDLQQIESPSARTVGVGVSPGGYLAKHAG